MAVIENPFIPANQPPQYLTWQFFLDGEEYHLEFILPAKSMVHPYKEGGYLFIAVNTLEPHITPIETLPPGTLLVVGIPFKTFMGAWQRISYNWRQSLQSNENIILKFKRLSRQKIILLKMKKTIASTEQIAFAQRAYADADQYKAREDDT